MPKEYVLQLGHHSITSLWNRWFMKKMQLYIPALLPRPCEKERKQATYKSTGFEILNIFMLGMCLRGKPLSLPSAVVENSTRIPIQHLISRWLDFNDTVSLKILLTLELKIFFDFVSFNYYRRYFYMYERLQKIKQHQWCAIY